MEASVSILVGGIGRAHSVLEEWFRTRVAMPKTLIGLPLFAFIKIGVLILRGCGRSENREQRATLRTDILTRMYNLILILGR